MRDDSIERSERILKLLDQVKKIERGEAEPPPLAFHGEEEWSDEEEEGDELELEGGSGESWDGVRKCIGWRVDWR